MGPFIPANLSISLPGCQFPQGLGCLRVAHSPSPDEAPHLGGTQETMGRCLGKPDGSEQPRSNTRAPRWSRRAPDTTPCPAVPGAIPGAFPAAAAARRGGVGLAVIHLPASPLQRAHVNEISN